MKGGGGVKSSDFIKYPIMSIKHFVLYSTIPNWHSTIILKQSLQNLYECIIEVYIGYKKEKKLQLFIGFFYNFLLKQTTTFRHYPLPKVAE